MSQIFVYLFLIFFNIYNCSSQNTNYNVYINTTNDSFYQDEQQRPVQIIYNVYNININGKDVDIKKWLKLTDVNTVEPVLNVNNTVTSNHTNSEVTTMSTTTTTAIQNKDKEVEKVLKVRDDYTLYPGHGYYKYHSNNGTLSWNQARDICVKEGAHLVVINSQAEADLLKGIIKTNKYYDGIFVGFYRTSTSSDFITVLGGRASESGYNRWWPGSPRTDSGWDCGYMAIDGTLVNHPCTDNHSFICEI